MYVQHAVVEETESNGDAPLRTQDNPLNRRIVVRLLQRAGHTVVTANDGKEAVEAAEGTLFDLILMDMCVFLFVRKIFLCICSCDVAQRDASNGWH